MPQLNKGGKFVFGKSLIQPDGSVQIPPQAVEEYAASSEGRVCLYLPGRKPPAASASRAGACCCPQSLGIF